MKGTARYDIGLLVLRVALGLIMLFYGSQKMFGLFGGMGYSATINMFTADMHVPPVFAHLAIVGEFFGGLGVLFGGLTSVAAFGVACTMGVATFMNARGPEVMSKLFSSGDPADSSKVFYSSSLLFMAIAVMIMGAGQYSLDARLFGKKRKR